MRRPCPHTQDAPTDLCHTKPGSPQHTKRHLRRFASDEGHAGWRLPAAEIERTIAGAVRKDRQTQLAWAASGQSRSGDADILDQVTKAHIKDSHLEIKLVPPNEAAPRTLSVPYTLRRRGVETRLVLKCEADREPDTALARRILRAMGWVDRLKSGQAISGIAAAENISPEYITHNLHFGLLSARVLEAVITGNQPPNLSAKTITRMRRFPTDWDAQNTLLLQGN